MRRFPIPSKSRFRWALTAAHGTISNKRLCVRSRFPGLCLPPALPGAKPARQELPSGFIRFDVHALKVGSSLRGLRSQRLQHPLVQKQKALSRRNYCHITPRHPRPPAGACANHIPSSHRICRPLRIIAPHGTAPIARMRRARAGFKRAARCAKRVPRPPPGGCKRKCRPNRRLWRGKCGKG